jgi:hypothetical protein
MKFFKRPSPLIN